MLVNKPVMERTDCICLPFLHIEKNSQLPEMTWALWPGLPEIPAGYWQPGGYPFAPWLARRILDDISALPLPDLESYKFNSSPVPMRDELKNQEEIGAIAKFSGLETIASPEKLIREKAHTMLIWQWLWETAAEEIRELEAKCQNVNQLLARSFGENPCGNDVGLSDMNDGQQKGSMESLPGCNWKTLLANAVVFIPEGMNIFLDDRIIGDIFDMPGCEAGNWQKTDRENAERLISITAPLWRILGKSRAMDSGYFYLDNIFNMERRWISRL